jgi:hypothetical protein
MLNSTLRSQKTDTEVDTDYGECTGVLWQDLMDKNFTHFESSAKQLRTKQTGFCHL